jgi:hypothetical protein
LSKRRGQSPIVLSRRGGTKSTPPAANPFSFNGEASSGSAVSPPNLACRRGRPDIYRLLRAIGSLLSRYLNRQTLGAYPHPAADLAIVSQILKPADVVLVEGKRRISRGIKYLTQSSWSHAAIYVGGCDGVDAEGRVRAFVEADMENGVRAFPIEELGGLHLRSCRPVGLSSRDVRQVVNPVAHIGRALRRFLRPRGITGRLMESPPHRALRAQTGERAALGCPSQ